METPNSTVLEQRIRALLGEEPSEQLRKLLAETEPVEIARVFDQFTIPEQQMLLGVMEKGVAARVVIELDNPPLEGLFANLPLERLADYIDLMEPDDAADLVGMMELAVAESVLERLRPALREEITGLLTHGPETAGGIMDPDVVQVRASQSVSEALEDIRRYVTRVRLDDFFSVFAVNEMGQLVGVVPNWKMLLAAPDDLIESLMIPDPIAVEAHLDQEDVSRLVRDHDLVTVPVVDYHRHLIGRITVDDIVDVIEEEHSEDLGRMAGTMGEGIRPASLFQTLRERAPWLFIALAGEFILAVIMHSRQDYLVTLPQLALFIPVIMAMGGNTGMQSSSLVIRGLATGEVRLAHFWRRLAREFLIAMCIGLLFALLLIAGSMLLTSRFKLGVAVGLATLATITLASCAGTVIPMVLRWLNLDPALATGPFLTTMNDVMGIAVYLLIAYLLLF